MRHDRESEHDQNYYLRLPDDPEIDDLLATAESYRKTMNRGYPYLTLMETESLIERIVRVYGTKVLVTRTLAKNDGATLLESCLANLPSLKDMENEFIVLSDDEDSRYFNDHSGDGGGFGILTKLSALREKVTMTIKILNIAKLLRYSYLDRVPSVDWDWIYSRFDSSSIRIIDFTFEEIENNERTDVKKTDDNGVTLASTIPPSMVKKYKLKFLPELRLEEPILNTNDPILDTLFSISDYYYDHGCLAIRHVAFLTRFSTRRTTRAFALEKLKIRVEEILGNCDDEENEETASNDDNDDDEDIVRFVEAFLYVQFYEYRRASQNSLNIFDDFQLHSDNLRFAWRLLPLNIFLTNFFTIVLSQDIGGTNLEFYKNSTSVLFDRLVYAYDVDQRYLRWIRKLFVDISKYVDFGRRTCFVARLLLPLSFYVSRKLIRVACKRIVLGVRQHVLGRKNILRVNERADLSDTLDIVDVMTALRDMKSLREITYRDATKPQIKVKNVTNVRNTNFSSPRITEYINVIDSKINDCIITAGHDPTTAKIDNWREIRSKIDVRNVYTPSPSVFTAASEPSVSLARDNLEFKRRDIYDRVRSIVDKILRGSRSRKKSSLTLNCITPAIANMNLGTEFEIAEKIVLNRWTIHGIEVSPLKDSRYVGVLRTLVDRCRSFND